MRMRPSFGGVWVIVCLAFVAACNDAGTGDYGDDDASSPTPTPGPSGTPTPPEGDDDTFLVAPAVAATYVYVANPDLDDVARVDATTMHVDVIPVGDKPVDLRVAPDGSYFATFNSLSHDVSVVDATTLAVTDLAVRPVTNRMSTSPLGTHGLCWYDRARDADGGVSGSQNPGEVSIVDLVTRSVVSGVMGLEPKGVAFTNDDTRAFVLSDGLIASIDLTLPAKPKTLVPLTADPTTAPPAQEIQVAPDGSTALVLSAAGLTLVDLATSTRTPLAVGAPGTTPTDLDLTSDGRFYAVASVGTNSTIDLFDRQNAFARTTVAIPGPAGSMEMAPDDDEIWAFSRGALDERIWRIRVNAGAPDLTEYALVKPVRSVYVAPAGAGVLILHRFEDVLDGAPSSEGSYADDHVMTVLDADAGGGVPLLSSVALDGPPDQVAVTSDGTWAFAQVPATNKELVIDLGSLLVDAIPLASQPLFTGAIDATNTGYVLQKHPLGRITFVRPQLMDVDTVTGFEINAEIDP